MTSIELIVSSYISSFVSYPWFVVNRYAAYRGILKDPKEIYK